MEYGKEQRTEEAMKEFEAMELDQLQRFVDKQLNPDEQLSAWPTVTEDFTEEDILKIAGEVLESRKAGGR